MLKPVLLDEAELHSLIEQTVQKTVERTIQNFQGTTSKQSPNPEPYLTRKEVCKLLRISLVTLHVRMKAGEVPYHRIGKRILFLNSEVQSTLSPRKLTKGA